MNRVIKAFVGLFLPVTLVLPYFLFGIASPTASLVGRPINAIKLYWPTDSFSAYFKFGLYHNCQVKRLKFYGGKYFILSSRKVYQDEYSKYLHLKSGNRINKVTWTASSLRYGFKTIILDMRSNYISYSKDNKKKYRSYMIKERFLVIKKSSGYTIKAVIKTRNPVLKINPGYDPCLGQKCKEERVYV